MSFLNRVRLPFYLSKPQYPAEEDVYLKANGRRVTMKSIVNKLMEGETDYMPYQLHERLTIALRHDEVNIEHENFVGSVRLADAYDIQWQDFLDYPFAQAIFKAFEEAFVARSNKCDICVESTTLSLVDDEMEELLEEGVEYELNVAENDNICCSSPVFSIETYDEDFIDSISISQLGVVTFTLKTPIDSAPDKLLFTYKVVCSEEIFETANVYGTIEGSLTPLCEAPSNLVLTAPDSESIHAEWDAPSGGAPADGYQWILRKWPSEIVVSSGDVVGTSVDINSLDCEEQYRLSVRAVCDVDTSYWSSYINEEITLPVCVAYETFSVRAADGTASICGQTPITVYTAPGGSISVGNIIYFDSALTMPVDSYLYVIEGGQDVAGTLYEVNTSGEIVTNLGTFCS